MVSYHPRALAISLKCGVPLGGGGQTDRPHFIPPSHPHSLPGATQTHSVTRILSHILPDSHLTPPDLDLSSCASEVSYTHTHPCPFSCGPDLPLTWTQLFHSPLTPMIAPMLVGSHSRDHVVNVPTCAHMHACFALLVCGALSHLLTYTKWVC